MVKPMVMPPLHMFYEKLMREINSLDHDPTRLGKQLGHSYDLERSYCRFNKPTLALCGSSEFKTLAAQPQHTQVLGTCRASRIS